jgi:5-methylcytosine-specific restriction protein A
MARLLTLKGRLQGMPASTIQRIGSTTIERKRGSAGVKDRNAIKARDMGLCQECKRNGLVSLGVVVDHIVPLEDGGSDESNNKECLCKSCHDAKTAYEATQRARSRQG